MNYMVTCIASLALFPGTLFSGDISPLAHHNPATILQFDNTPRFPEQTQIAYSGDQGVTQEQLLRAYEERRKQKKRQQEQQKKAKDKRSATIKKQCARIKNYLNTGGAVYNLNDDGERVFMSEAEVRAYRAQKQKEYDTYCK